MMNKPSSLPLLAIDAAGAVLFAACLGGFLWLALVSPESVYAERVELRRTLESSRQHLASLRALSERQSALLRGYRDELDRLGQLPEEPPLEGYFAELSRMAAASGLRVLRQAPLETRRYSGLTEHCFEYQVVGSSTGIMNLLRAIEESPYWADVGYLSLEENRGVVGEDSGARVAALTLSVFSSPPAPAAPPPSLSGITP